MTWRILKISGWIFLALLVVAGTIALVLLGRGYSYDWHTGRVKLSGLVIFASTPSGADITMNGKSIHHRTPYRTTLEAGDYSFDVTKAGYRPWSKRISIVASEVSWVQYILMLPNQLSQSAWFSAAGLAQLTTSRDHRHFAYVDTNGVVYSFETGNHRPTRLYTAGAPAAGQPVEAVTGLEWAPDASTLLVTTQSGGKTYQRLVPAGGGEALKLTEQYGFDLTGLRFNPANAKQLFWLAPEGLRRIDTGNQTVSAVLVDKVAGYSFGGNGQIIYVQATDLGKSLFAMDAAGGNKHQLIQSLADSPSYQISYGSYRGSDIVAVLPTATRTVTLYTDITTDNPVAKVLTKSADDLRLGPDGRFLNWRDHQTLATYDLELNRSYHFAPSATPYQQIQWFDTYHLLVANAKGLNLIEYDGANASELTKQFLPGQVTYTSNQHEVLVAEPDQSGIKLIAITIKH